MVDQQLSPDYGLPQVVLCETPDGCTCGAPATTPRGMHHGYCAIRGDATDPAPDVPTDCISLRMEQIEAGIEEVIEANAVWPDPS